jgi:hypothetical protein
VKASTSVTASATRSPRSTVTSLRQKLSRYWTPEKGRLRKDLRRTLVSVRFRPKADIRTWAVRQFHRGNPR